jgi:hypothetical protein
MYSLVSKMGGVFTDCMLEFYYLSWHSLVLTLILLTWRIWWAPNNTSKWQMGFNSAFKGLKNYLIQEIFSERQEGPLTSSCTVWSIIFYLYCNPLFVTLHLSDTRIFDCAFLWIWGKCTAVLLSSCLCCFLDACRVGFMFLIIFIWQFVPEWYSLTIGVTSGVLVPGSHYGSCIPKYCRGYLVYSCSDIVWWWQHW